MHFDRLTGIEEIPLDVEIHYNESEEKMQITNKKGKVLFNGNYSDFNKTPNNLAELFSELGLKVGISNTLKK